jgi:hypothetical protein
VVQVFTTLLKMNFEDIGNTCQKIDGGRVVFRNNHTRRNFVLKGDCSSAFFPGETTEMRMEQWKLCGLHPVLSMNSCAKVLRTTIRSIGIIFKSSSGDVC